MEIRGIVETQQGTGTFVATRRADRKSGERKKALEGLVDRFVALAASSGFSLEELAESVVERSEKAEALEDAMSRQAQAERERQARIIGVGPPGQRRAHTNRGARPGALPLRRDLTVAARLSGGR